MRERVEWIDAAKGIGILFVFLGHLVEKSWPGIWAYSFHLPLFFFLSGYLFSVKNDFKSFLKKKAKSLLIPYVTMGLVICVFDALWNHLLTKSNFHPPFLPRFLKDLVYLLLQVRFATLWYLAVLLGVNIFAYFLVKYIKNKCAAIIIVIGLCIFGYFYYKWGGSSLIWNVDVIVMAMPFFLGGYLFQQYPILQGPFLSKKIGSVSLAGLLFMVSQCLTFFNKEKTGFSLEMYYNKYGILPVTYLCAFAGILMTVIVANHLKPKWLCYIGKNSLVYFLLHQAVIYPLLDFIYFRLGYGSTYTSTWRFIWVVSTKIGITCILLFFVNELLIKTKLRVLLGKN